MISSNQAADSGRREAILIIRLSSLGDILLTAPVVRALRKRFPDAHLDFLVERRFESAARLIPGPDRILTYDRSSGFRGLRQLGRDLARQYDILVDLQNSLRSVYLRTFCFPTLWVRAHRYRLRRWLLIHWKWRPFSRIIPVPERYLAAVFSIGAVDDGAGLDLSIPDGAEAGIRDVLDRLGSRPFCVFCPGARHATKQWPADRWIAAGRMLSESGSAVVVIGDEGEKGLVREIAESVPDSVAVWGKTIPEVAVLMRSASCVVSGDTGLMHLAAGLKTPVVALFGPTVAEFGFNPFRAASTVIEQKLSCRPCSPHGTESCPKRHFKCMLDTAPERVIEAVNRLLKRTPD